MLLNNFVFFFMIFGIVLIRLGFVEEFLISFVVVKFSVGVKFLLYYLFVEYNEEELGIKGFVDVFF